MPIRALRTVGWFLLSMLAVVILLFPIYWMLTTSLKPNAEVFKYPPTFLPRQPTLEAYGRVLGDKEYIRYYGNSYLVATMVSLVTVVLGGLAGYGFSRFRMKGGKALLMSVLLLHIVSASCVDSTFLLNIRLAAPLQHIRCFSNGQHLIHTSVFYLDVERLL